MKARINFNNTSVEIGSNGKMKFIQGNSSLPGSGSIEYELDLFKALNWILPFDINSFHNSHIKTEEKPNDAGNKSINDILGKPGYLIANGHDIFNYVARFGSANFQIQIVMKLNGRLDPDKLQKAIRLSIEAEPVFGSRLIVNNPPYWKRLDDIDKVTFCTFEETCNPDEAVKRFLESPLNMDKDPMVKLKLISSDTNDILCLKINHACCDGTGAKEYIKLLSEIYTCIDQDNGIYVPKPGFRGRTEQDMLFSVLGISDPETAWNGELDIKKTNWSFPWRQGKSNITRTAICRLPEGHVEVMSKYAKARGASINDLILTAFYRAMFRFSCPQTGIPYDISMTADLRRYLPNQKTEAIRNFSGGINSKLAMIENEDFDGTLSRVVPMMNEIKKNYPGLQSAIGLERVEKALFNETLLYYQDESRNSSYKDKCSPVLSNLGFISRSLLKFNKTDVIDAFIIPPAISAPGMLLCVGTYNEIMTFAISFYESQVSETNINRLLNMIKDELVRWCIN